MTKIKKLFKLQLDNKFTLFKEKNVKKFLLQLFKYIVLITAITLGLFLILNKLFFVLNIKVNAEYSVSQENGYKTIKIGSANTT